MGFHLYSDRTSVTGMRNEKRTLMVKQDIISVRHTSVPHALGVVLEIIIRLYYHFPFTYLID